jgi:glycogen(starch) synthase
LFAYPRKNLTYHHDIIGLKIYDALRMGVPIVTSDVGELGELIRKEGVGLTSRPEDNSDFARTALTLLTDEKLYARIKKNVARLQHHFDWETACKPLAQTYDSLLREKRRK